MKLCKCNKLLFIRNVFFVLFTGMTSALPQQQYSSPPQQYIGNQPGQYPQQSPPQGPQEQPQPPPTSSNEAQLISFD